MKEETGVVIYNYDTGEQVSGEFNPPIEWLLECLFLPYAKSIAERKQKEIQSKEATEKHEQ